MKILKQFSLLFISLLFLVQSHAQIGITGAYFQQQIPEWETAVFGNNSSDDLLKTGYSVGVDYWLKPLENYRVELYPEVLFNSATTYTRNIEIESYELVSLGFNLNTNIYVLNIESDCDCPTFSKQESFFEKGFFIQIAPGIHYFKGKYNPPGGSADPNMQMTDIAPKLGLGLGLDIGISDFITITPIVKYNRYFNVEWDGLLRMINEPTSSIVLGSNTSNINQFYAGIHVGVRFNE